MLCTAYIINNVCFNLFLLLSDLSTYMYLSTIQYLAFNNLAIKQRNKKQSV